MNAKIQAWRQRFIDHYAGKHMFPEITMAAKKKPKKKKPKKPKKSY